MIPAVEYSYFKPGPFCVPVLHFADETVSALGVYYPSSTSSRKRAGEINALVKAVLTQQSQVIRMVAQLIAYSLTHGKQLVIAGMPADDINQVSPAQLIAALVSQYRSDCIDASSQIKRVLSVREHERDLDTLERSLAIDEIATNGETVILFDVLMHTNDPSSLQLCKQTLIDRGIEVYTICLGKVFSQGFPETETYSLYWRQFYDLCLVHYEEYLDYIGDFARKTMKEFGAYEYGGDYSGLLTMPDDAVLDPLLAEATALYADGATYGYFKEVVELAHNEMLEDVTAAGEYYEEELSYAISPTKALAYVKKLDEFLTQHTRLHLGEHDFTFTDALIKKHGARHPLLPLTVTATEYMSQTRIEELDRVRAPLFKARLQALTAKGVSVLFNVDARDLQSQVSLPRRIPRVTFHFPHDGSSFKAQTLPRLLQQAFQSIAEFQGEGDKIHMALAQPLGKADFYQGYIYNIYNAAARSGYVLLIKKRFDNLRYPGYQHAMTTQQGGAPVAQEAREFVFIKTNLSYAEVLQHSTPRIGRFYSEPRQLLPATTTASASNSTVSMDETELQAARIENFTL